MFSYADYFPQSNLARRFGHVKTNITIGELLIEFLEQIKATREHSTYIGYKKVCYARLIPYFGSVAIQDLKPAFIREWIRGLGITSKTLSNMLIPLRAIIEQALNDEYIKTNPLDKIVISKLLCKQTSRSNFKVDPFDKQEVKLLLDATHHEQIKNLFQFAFFTGLRTSELIALEWGDIEKHSLLHPIGEVFLRHVLENSYQLPSLNPKFLSNKSTYIMNRWTIIQSNTILLIAG